MATRYNLAAGHVLAVTAGPTRAVVQDESGAVVATIVAGFPVSIGPYLVDRSFLVSDGAAASTTAYTTAIGGLLLSTAAEPVDAVASSVAIDPTGDDNALTFTARAYGPAGDAISVRYVDPGAASQSLSVEVAGPAITVKLATDEAGEITSTAAEIKAAIEASGPANALVSVAIVEGDGEESEDDGSGVATAISSTSLESGAGFGIGLAAPGALCIDTENSDVYRNDGTTAAPTWVKVGDA